MADFCKQCSLKNFGEDFGDLSGLITEEDTKKATVAVVICEGCGPTCVDHLGVCVDPNCLESHGGRPD